jgi:hypothetical protein
MIQMALGERGGITELAFGFSYASFLPTVTDDNGQGFGKKVRKRFVCTEMKH